MSDSFASTCRPITDVRVKEQDGRIVVDFPEGFYTGLSVQLTPDLARALRDALTEHIEPVVTR